MDLTLSRRGDYVMRSAMSLARAYDEPKSKKIREVVADTEVPQSFASQILADLVRAGLATSRAGRDGGYRLARPPAEISLLEVIEASEGPLRANRCALGEGPCRWDSVCPLHETWTEATAMLRDLLRRTDLATLAERDRAIEQGLYSVPADSHRAHPTSVTVEDAVHVELSQAVVEAALSAPGEQLEKVVGDASRAGVTGGGAGPLPVSELTLIPSGADRRRIPGSPSSYMLAWRIDGSEGSGRVEADLMVEAVDPDRSEIRVRATWYGRSASPVSAADLEGRVRRMLRLFLRGLALVLELEAVSRPSRVSG